MGSLAPARHWIWLMKSNAQLEASSLSDRYGANFARLRFLEGQGPSNYPILFLAGTLLGLVPLEQSTSLEGDALEAGFFQGMEQGKKHSCFFGTSCHMLR